MEHGGDADGSCDCYTWDNPQDMEMRWHVDTIQTIGLIWLVRILRRFLETCCQSNSSKNPSTNAEDVSKE